MSALRLHRDAGGYSLIDAERGTRTAVDFEAVHRRLERGGRELLLRAVGARPGLNVVDCTAGLGTEAFLLAARGCEVTMVERSGTLALMLEDALSRAHTDARLAAVAQRMTLVRGDARHYLSSLRQTRDRPDVITIDPMFPTRTKSARVSAPLETLQRLLGKDESVGPLIDSARRAAIQRVVVKRPLRASPLGSPSGSVRGKASRYDIYAPL